MTSVHQAFERAATNFDRYRNALIPDYEDFYGAALAALPNDHLKAYRILDLGAGTGAFSELIGEAYKHAQITVSDFAPAMLEQARDKLGASKRFSFQQIDMLLDPLPDDLDIIVSSMAIHHFDHADKRFVFSRICKALKPGGVFINADQVSSGRVAEDRRQFDHWLADVRAAGICEKELGRVLERMRTHDQNAPHDLQIRWLRGAGFVEAQMPYRNYFWAVFKATK